MNTFDHFPREKTTCPICGGRDDKPCFLMPIDGTEDGLTSEAQPTHIDCMRDHADKFRLNREAGFIYTRVES